MALFVSVSFRLLRFPMEKVFRNRQSFFLVRTPARRSTQGIQAKGFVNMGIGWPTIGVKQYLVEFTCHDTCENLFLFRVNFYVTCGRWCKTCLALLLHVFLLLTSTFCVSIQNAPCLNSRRPCGSTHRSVGNLHTRRGDKKRRNDQKCTETTRREETRQERE